ncbi:MAG: hypothetical protein GY943_07370, partial [Chloroflexi bacterium]|nr:hypothetical protein [Chloroflexota bacterium]
IPREEHAAIFKRICGWLRVNGRLLISMEAEDLEGGVGEWLGVPMFFSSYDPETVKKLIVAAGFEIVETTVEIQVESETEIPYLWMLAKKT